MMKNVNIQKINTLGKVSRIVLTIMRVFCIIGIVSCLVGTIIVGVAIDADSVFNVNGTASAQITVDENSQFIVQDNKIYIGKMELFSIDDLENSEENIDFMGTNVEIDIDKSENNGLTVYDITADIDADSIKSVKFTACLMCLAYALICAIMLLVVIFAGKFAKALEVCESPFEENVIQAMKHFGFSLLPMGVVYFSGGGIDLTAIVLIVAIIIFTYIFRYGAELQKESDEII